MYNVFKNWELFYRANFDKSKKTVFLVHGYSIAGFSSYKDAFMIAAKDEILSKVYKNSFKNPLFINAEINLPVNNIKTVKHLIFKMHHFFRF